MAKKITQKELEHMAKEAHTVIMNKAGQIEKIIRHTHAGVQEVIINDNINQKNAGSGKN